MGLRLRLAVMAGLGMVAGFAGGLPVCQPAHAREESGYKTRYLSPSEVVSITEGVVAPAVGSATDHNDLLEVRRREARRTPEDCARALREVEPSTRNFWVESKVLTPGEAALVQPLMVAVWRDVMAPVSILKERYRRVRPHLRNEGVRPCSGLPQRYSPGDSFPSGHAAGGYAEGMALSEIFPERRERIMKQAADIGWNRVVLGVHHPSDVEAGVEIARRSMTALMRSTSFRRNLERTKAKFGAAEQAPVTSGRGR